MTQLGEERPQLSRVDRKILTHITRSGDANKYEITKTLKLSYSSVYKRIKYLIRMGCIQITKTLPGTKNPDMKVHYYGLTDYGWVVASNYDDFWKYIDDIANKNEAKLPLVFGKWAFFRKKGKLDTIIARLQTAFFIAWKNQVRGPLILMEKDSKEPIKIRLERIKDKETRERVLRRHKRITDIWDGITAKTIGFDNFLWRKDSQYQPYQEFVKQFQKDIEDLSEDADLRNYIDEELNHWVDKCKTSYENVCAWKEWYGKLKAKSTSL